MFEFVVVLGEEYRGVGAQSSNGLLDGRRGQTESINGGGARILHGLGADGFEQGCMDRIPGQLAGLVGGAGLKGDEHFISHPTDNSGRCGSIIQSFQPRQ